MSDQYDFEIPTEARVPVPANGPEAFAPKHLRARLNAVFEQQLSAADRDELRKSEEPAPQAPSLPLDRHKTVEAGLAAFQETARERDELRREVARLKEEVTRRDVRIDEMTKLTNLIESRINTALIQRDAAVSEAARYDGLFVAIDAIVRKAIPAAPLPPIPGPSDEGQA